MRAIVVTRVPVLLLLPLFLLLGGGTAVKVYVDGVGGGDVGPDGIDLCVEENPLEQQKLVELGADHELASTCVRMTFCAGVGLDSMSQQVCAPID